MTYVIAASTFYDYEIYVQYIFKNGKDSTTHYLNLLEYHLKLLDVCHIK